jgi:hypothetical protein
VKRLLIGVGIAVLVSVAVYSAFVAVRASLTAEGYDPSIFWTAIGILFVIAAVALWVATESISPPPRSSAARLSSDRE